MAFDFSVPERVAEWRTRIAAFVADGGCGTSSKRASRRRRASASRERRSAAGHRPVPSARFAQVACDPVAYLLARLGGDGEEFGAFGVGERVVVLADAVGQKLDQ
jgi:hypothetical protein